MLAPTEYAMSWNQAPAKPVSPQASKYAKVLRRALTDPEKRLWRHLRSRLPLKGTHFRRQIPIGPFIADFCSFGAKLIVEVDGGQHTTDEALAYDSRRTAFLEAQGFHVLRFSNADVMKNIDVVLDTIDAALASATPTPSPSPQGGGERET